MQPCGKRSLYRLIKRQPQLNTERKFIKPHGKKNIFLRKKSHIQLRFIMNVLKTKQLSSVCEN